jgi:hypothetical protein
MLRLHKNKNNKRSKMSSFRSIVDLNNTAVALSTRQQDVAEAAQLLLHALNQLREQIPRCGEEEDGRTTYDCRIVNTRGYSLREADLSMGVFRVSLDHALAEQATVDVGSSSHSGSDLYPWASDGSDLRMYTCGFLLPNRPFSHSTRHVGGTIIFVLFNAGLAFHRLSMKTGHSSGPLKKAALLYGKAIALLQKFFLENFEWVDVRGNNGDAEASFSPTTHDSNLVVVSLALYLNMAHIHSQSFNKVETCYYMAGFRHCFARAQACHMTPREHCFFSVNAWFADCHPSFVIAGAA